MTQRKDLIDRPYKLNYAPSAIPSDVLPGLYREIRTLWVRHLKADQHVARTSLKPMMDALRTELKERGLNSTSDFERHPDLEVIS